MAGQTNDFIAETKGSCFLCSHQISIRSRTVEFKSESCPTYSLDCLSRYLKIDMKKVFTGSGPIPPHLVARVEQSQLKTELCEKCVVLTRKFSKLYRQWEKTEMEMASCLNLFQENLERAVKSENNYKVRNWNGTDGNSQDEWMAKMEIVEALRKDTMEKCSRKLEAAGPFTKLQRLSRQQVNKMKRKIQSRKVSRHPRRSSQYCGSTYDEAFDDDTEGIGSPSYLHEEDGNDYADNQNYSTQPTLLIQNHVIEPEAVKTEGSEEMQLDDTRIEMATATNDLSKCQQIYSTTTTLSNTARNGGADQLSQAIPPPIIVESEYVTVEKPDISKNPETGKYRCPICSKEYTLYTSSYNHYRSVHLKVKYKCTICKKDFPFKQGYKNHYLSVHMGVRFKCVTCNKTFTEKGKLRLHQRNAH